MYISPPKYVSSSAPNYFTNLLKLHLKDILLFDKPNTEFRISVYKISTRRRENPEDIQLQTPTYLPPSVTCCSTNSYEYVEIIFNTENILYVTINT